MLKHRELSETNELYQLMSHPSVFPYVRQKATSADEYMFMTKQLIEEEQLGKTISRTITDDWGQPIGTISLFDIQDGAGFLGTWIGVPYQGKGYNQLAKKLFLTELFFEYQIHTVFLRIRKENEKSKRASMKLPYVIEANDCHQALFNEINAGEMKYDLYKIPKDLFYLVTANEKTNEEEQAM
ncbi:alanine acetyltransferase [Ureibacillus massiliensis 4400831 = CIP 108448 = CCUG 49529]|uniref:Alanine acetyltransferase n=1 Tax=Ureibacillus massiliensis 4400831 = CIP 108448 = CCUG 49529 TaxID=1211035 RepID=A0A0A3IXT3_9BACL|nr:GNAT family protein [Ureibacillus massiliensis]KGR89589.1 alanine acetyltransferase [Ureibacillus massiliensis 4400831 = CIP 108448 = CCUG 49529]